MQQEPIVSGAMTMEEEIQELCGILRGHQDALKLLASNLSRNELLKELRELLVLKSLEEQHQRFEDELCSPAHKTFAKNLQGLYNPKKKSDKLSKPTLGMINGLTAQVTGFPKKNLLQVRSWEPIFAEIKRIKEYMIQMNHQLPFLDLMQAELEEIEFMVTGQQLPQNVLYRVLTLELSLGMKINRMYQHSINVIFGRFYEQVVAGTFTDTYKALEKEKVRMI